MLGLGPEIGAQLQFHQRDDRGNGLHGPIQRHAQKVDPSCAQTRAADRERAAHDGGGIAGDQQAQCGGIDPRQAGDGQHTTYQQGRPVQRGRQDGRADRHGKTDDGAEIQLGWPAQLHRHGLEKALEPA